MNLTVAEIADRLGGILDGDGSGGVHGVAGIREAKAGEATFQSGRRYAKAVAETRATVVIVDKIWEGDCPCALIRVAEPEKAFARVAGWFAPPERAYEPGIHPSAIVDPGATLGEGVTVGPCCVVEADVVIGARTVLVGMVFVGKGSRVGEDGLVHPLVSIRDHTAIGDRVILHSGVVIGSDGFGYEPQGETWIKIPQIGTVEIGDDVEIGANSAVDRGRFGKTVIGNGVKIDNLVQIAHNVQVGDGSAMAGQVGISGSTIVGRHVQLAGQSGLAGHIEVGDNTVIGAKSGLAKDAPANAFLIGSPAMPRVEFAKSLARVAKLPELMKRVSELEDRLAELEQGDEE